MKKTRVLWLTNIPSPYRVDFFNELGQYCELTVVFESRQSDERDKSWQNFEINHFEAIFLKGIKIGVAEAFCPGALKYINRKKYDKFVVTNYSDMTGMIAVLAMKIAHIPYIIEGDGAFAGSGKGIKEKLKKAIISYAELCFSTSKQHDEYYQKYGGKKIIRYTFTSLKAEELALRKEKNMYIKKELRKELGITEKYVVLSVGRFNYQAGYGKGFDTLMKASQLLSSDIGVYIVGDLPTEEFVRWKREKNIVNIHFIGYKEKNELMRYYAMADVFALLSRGEAWGLVINEAMSFGLPIITTNRCVAGIELIKNGRNGFIVEVDDYEDVVNKIEYIIGHEYLREKMRKENLTIINEYTIENMVKDHFCILENRMKSRD